MEQRDEPPLSTLTALERDCWAEDREAMQNDDPINAASLLEVESALFHLTLHEASPATKEEAATLCHGGDGRNKWFDKSFNIILFENGKGGLNAEHTAVDAMTLVSIFSEANARIAKHVHRAAARLDAPPPPRAAAVEPPRRAPIHWALGARTHMLIERASAEIGALAYDCELRAVHYPHLLARGDQIGTRSSPTSSCRWRSSSRSTGCTASAGRRTRRGTRAPASTGGRTRSARCRRRASSG